MNKVKKHKTKGFTLMELLVVIAIIGIMTIPILNIMSSNSQIVKMSGEKIQAKTLAMLVEQELKKELRLMNKVQIGGTTTGSELISPTDRITLSPANVDLKVTRLDGSVEVLVPRSFIDPYRIELSFEDASVAGRSVVRAKIFVLEDADHDGYYDEELYSLETHIQLIQKGLTYTTGSGDTIYYHYTTP